MGDNLPTESTPVDVTNSTAIPVATEAETVASSSVADFVTVTVDTAIVASTSDTSRKYWALTTIDKNIYIRFIPAATDSSERKGIYLKKDQTYEMPTSIVYTGEISVINAKDNEEPQFSITEY